MKIIMEYTLLIIGYIYIYNNNQCIFHNNLYFKAIIDLKISILVHMV